MIRDLAELWMRSSQLVKLSDCQEGEQVVGRDRVRQFPVTQRWNKTITRGNDSTSRWVVDDI